jgi:hypothetical protein
MLEIRRDLYMDEATGLKRTNFSAIADQLCALLEALARRWANSKAVAD